MKKKLGGYFSKVVGKNFRVGDTVVMTNCIDQTDICAEYFSRKKQGRVVQVSNKGLFPYTVKFGNNFYYCSDYHLTAG
jgi:hypothetical protein